MSILAEYVAHGWAIVPIPPGTKGPNGSGWNLRENCITTPEAAAKLNGGSNAGLAHAFSGTCALDVDQYEHARDWLAAKGIDLDGLLAADDAVQISSGRPNRAKLLFKLPAGVEPLRSHKIKAPDGADALDFRCGTAKGTTVQDVLPPSVHPDPAGPG